MVLEEYYNEKASTLTIPFNFNEELKNLPFDIKIIIFEEYFPFWKYSNFNQRVDDLPNTLTHLTFGSYFNQKINNLPNSLTH